jgi:hypothetical protein
MKNSREDSTCREMKSGASRATGSKEEDMAELRENRPLRRDLQDTNLHLKTILPLFTDRNTRTIGQFFS